MKVSCQHHAPAALPPDKYPGAHFIGCGRVGLDVQVKKKSLIPTGIRTPHRLARILVTIPTAVSRPWCEAPFKISACPSVSARDLSRPLNVFSWNLVLPWSSACTGLVIHVTASDTLREDPRKAPVVCRAQVSARLRTVRRLVLQGEKKKNLMTARVSMLLKSRASPDVLPFILCNKKRLAIRHVNRPLFPTTLSIPSYDIVK